MKTVSHKKLYVRNPDTGEFEPLMAIVGESAYDIAVRLGTFTGTEEEWNNALEAERAAAVKSVEDKGAETLASIPDDYTELAEKAAKLETGKFDKANIAQELGDSEEIVVSQHAVTEEVNKLRADMSQLQIALVKSDELKTHYVNIHGEWLAHDSAYYSMYEPVEIDGVKEIAVKYVASANENVSSIVFTKRSELGASIIENIIINDGDWHKVVVPNDAKYMWVYYSDHNGQIPAIYVTKCVTVTSDIRNAINVVDALQYSLVKSDELKTHYVNINGVWSELASGQYSMYEPIDISAVGKVVVNYESFNPYVSAIVFTVDNDVGSAIVGREVITDSDLHTFEVPSSAKYMWVYYSDQNGHIPTLYLGERKNESGYNVENRVKLNLPESYALVVGDTFELFWKGVILTNNPYNYNIKVSCDIGRVYHRKYMVTPSVGNIGTHTMRVRLYDDGENLLDDKTVNLVVKNRASSPSVQKNILCVGDSLLVNGVWASESKRRLTGSGGTPTADGLTNINYMGSCVKDDVRFEGYGGWTFNSYNTENKTDSFMWITVSNHGKTEASDQHSIYKDSNGAQWKLETIETARIKVIRTSGYSALPSTGTLTWVSGGANRDDIVYTASEMAAGNPFWDDTTASVDFAKYAERMGVSTIDYVYVLLGWNSTNATNETYTEQVETFISNVHRSFPNCKIVLMGLQVPSLDGFGENYGCTWNYYEKLKRVFDFNNIYDSVANENANVYYVNIAGQFDTENNMQSATRPVNVRSTITETYQTNGVHPADSGYMQIADAVYRSITHRLQD